MCHREVGSTGSSSGECPDWSAACEVRLRSEGNQRRGTMRRRRGRRLLMVRLLLLLCRLFCGLFCCFLRCHENSTPLRCQNVDLCMCCISEIVPRVNFCLCVLTPLCPLAMEWGCVFRSRGSRTITTSTIPHVLRVDQSPAAWHSLACCLFDFRRKGVGNTFSLHDSPCLS